MIIFLDENDAEYGALATIKATNAVNGERSITGEIISGDVVLSRIERGWRLRFEDEYYVVTYAKPIDEGKNVQVSFDAVHQFFWDFGKSSVYDQLSDGSHTFRAYLDFIFKNSGYSYTVDTALNVYAFEKQSFGLKKRLTLFNDIITSTGVEFQVNGKVVRILAKVGTDLSTVVRKNFNLNELGIEKNIGDFVTYQKGYGAYFDDEDHSKGRLEVEYISPLASVYGKLEAEPFVDERYSQSGSLLAVLKANVDNSYTISVSLDMEDLTRAGYKYKQPVAGDYIMAINETLGFKEKIRIVSFTSEYDVAGQLIKHTVTCNDIGSVKKLSASYTQTQHQAANAEENANTAYEFANKALVSANGKNTNYYGDTFPVDNPKGTLKKGDLLFLTVGDTVKQYYWNGAEWATNPVVSDVEAFKEQIAEELKDVPNREEFENKIAEEVANSKAEIETQIETAKTQAESNAKEYADTINQETAKVAELANAAADEIKADLVNVKNNLTETSLVANNAQAAVDAAKQDLTNVTSELNTAKQDLMSHAQQLQTQANAQTELTKRVTTVETTANGTKTTVSELSKTVAQNGKDITSVTARTKIVEDDLTSTKTTLSQVKTTADSTSQKTATLETGLNGLSARFDSLKIGGRNLLVKTNQGKTNWSWRTSSGGTTAEDYNVDGINAVKLTRTSDASFTWHYIQYDGLIRKLIEPNTKYTLSFDAKPSVDVTFTAALKRGDDGGKLTNSVRMNKATANQWTKVSCVLTSNTTLPDDLSQVVYLSDMPVATGNWLIIKNIKLEKGNVATDYSPSEVDLEQKVAEYKQTADQNYASLQSNLQTLDGTVKQNKSEFDQTASQIKSSISAVESKIPTEIGAINLFKGSRDFSGSNWVNNGNGVYAEDYKGVKIFKTQAAWLGRSQYFETKTGEEYVFSAYVKSSAKTEYVGFYLTHSQKQPQAQGLVGIESADNLDSAYFNLTDEYQRIAIKIKITKDGWIMPRLERSNTDAYLFFGGYKLERGNVATDYSPAPEDTAEQISSLSSQIKQTADGMTLLATKTELNTLSGRVTTAENNITAKANELSSKITTVEGKIPTSIGGRNLLPKTNQGRTNWSWAISSGGTTAENYDADGVNAVKLTRTSDASFTWHYIAYWSLIRNLIEPNTKYTLSFDIKPSVDVTFSAALKRSDGGAPLTNVANMNKATANKWTKVSCVLTSTTTLSSDLSQVVFLSGMPVATGNWLIIKNIKLEKGVVSSDWSPAPEDYDSKLATAQSEFKQTTDSIKASVTSLNNSTVKSSSLTINSDGIVMKAGKSTTDVANAIGSYFSVNQNAINLFADKIKVKGNMIVNGAITSDKIASKQINTAHLNGKIITADVISSNAVTADAIRAGAVTTDKMSANSINGDRIAAGTLDAAKIKAGSITASQIASGTITSNQIKAGGISAANIAAGAITSDKIAANSIDASKIAANAITANMIRGGKLNSTNGATVFDLNAGTLTFNNNYGYIQRSASDKVFEITTYLGTTNDSRDYLTSDFKVRKSDNSRRAGIKFTLYNTLNDKPTAEGNINADALVLYDSQYTRLFEVWGKSTYMSNFNFRDWGDIPVAQVHGGFIAQDIGLRGHTETLKTIVERLCKKAGVMWL